MPAYKEELAADLLAEGDLIFVPPATVAYVSSVERRGGRLVVYLAHGKVLAFDPGELVTIVRSTRPDEPPLLSVS